MQLLRFIRGCQQSNFKDFNVFRAVTTVCKLAQPETWCYVRSGKDKPAEKDHATNDTIASAISQACSLGRPNDGPACTGIKSGQGGLDRERRKNGLDYRLFESPA